MSVCQPVHSICLPVYMQNVFIYFYLYIYARAPTRTHTHTHTHTHVVCRMYIEVYIQQNSCAHDCTASRLLGVLFYLRCSHIYRSAIPLPKTTIDFICCDTMWYNVVRIRHRLDSNY
jgi:uncharacterized membrane protein YbaN (DUF454 family)